MRDRFAGHDRTPSGDTRPSQHVRLSGVNGLAGADEDAGSDRLVNTACDGAAGDRPPDDGAGRVGPAAGQGPGPDDRLRPGRVRTAMERRRHRRCGGHNGCDTRNDVLRRDLRRHGDQAEHERLRRRWPAPSTTPTPGIGSSSCAASARPAVQIDHVVALANAWQTGAQLLSDAAAGGLRQRPAGARWPSTDAPTSRRAPATPPRGCRRTRPSGARTWPGRSRSRRSYDLWVTPAEHDAIDRVLADCPGEALPTPTDYDVGVPAPVRTG